MLTATILTCLITALTILIHYEAIRFVHRWHGGNWGGIRFKVISGVFLLFAAHSLEIWLFAAGIYFGQHVAHGVVAGKAGEAAFRIGDRD